MKTEPRLVDWSSPEPPVRVERPMLLQDWRECAFVHWRVDPAALRESIPPAFEIETADGSAWLSLIAFSIPHMEPGPLPPIPGLRSAAESHTRTYVRGPDGRRGIWMLGLDIDPLAAAIGGRGFLLPYWWADMEVTAGTEMARYRVQRRFPRARVELDMSVGEPYAPEELTELDHFLTARWVLYGGVGPMRTAILVEHPRWPLRRATVDRLEETISSADGYPPPKDPIAHYSIGVDAKLSYPKPFLAR